MFKRCVAPEENNR